jgi:hypothetical protein
MDSIPPYSGSSVDIGTTTGEVVGVLVLDAVVVVAEVADVDAVDVTPEVVVVVVVVVVVFGEHEEITMAMANRHETQITIVFRLISIPSYNILWLVYGLRFFGNQSVTESNLSLNYLIIIKIISLLKNILYYTNIVLDCQYVVLFNVKSIYQQA